MQDVRYTVQKLAAVAGAEHRVVGWAYIARKADGSLAEDSGGTTRDAQGNIIPDATGGDIVDTPEAWKALKDSFRAFITGGGATGDVMHEDFEQTVIGCGFPIEPEVTKALGIPDGILPTGLLVEILFPATPKGEAVWKRVESGELKALSMVMSLDREPVAESEIQHAA